MELEPYPVEVARRRIENEEAEDEEWMLLSDRTLSKRTLGSSVAASSALSSPFEASAAALSTWTTFRVTLVCLLKVKGCDVLLALFCLLTRSSRVRRSRRRNHSKVAVSTFGMSAIRGRKHRLSRYATQKRSTSHWKLHVRASRPSSELSMGPRHSR